MTFFFGQKDYLNIYRTAFIRTDVFLRRSGIKEHVVAIALLRVYHNNAKENERTKGHKQY